MKWIALTHMDLDEVVQIASDRGVPLDFGTAQVIGDYFLGRLRRRKKFEDDRNKNGRPLKSPHSCGICGVEGHNRKRCPRRLERAA